MTVVPTEVSPAATNDSANDDRPKAHTDDEAEASAPPAAKCSECGTSFTPRHPGQLTCGRVCSKARELRKKNERRGQAARGASVPTRPVVLSPELAAAGHAGNCNEAGPAPAAPLEGLGPWLAALPRVVEAIMLEGSWQLVRTA